MDNVDSVGGIYLSVLLVYGVRISYWIGCRGRPEVVMQFGRETRDRHR